MAEFVMDLNKYGSFVIKKDSTFNKTLISVSKNNFYNSNKKTTFINI